MPAKPPALLPFPRVQLHELRGGYTWTPSGGGQCVTIAAIRGVVPHWIHDGGATWKFRTQPGGKPFFFSNH
jgi:hypothetical protein